MQNWQYPLMLVIQEASRPTGVLIIVALVASIIALVRGLQSRIEFGGRTAIDLLNKRYAAGKISVLEYEERRQRLIRAH